MAKMTAEERHQKQKEKLTNQSAEQPVRPVQKSEKDKVMDELEALGFRYEMRQGIPTYKITTKAEAKFIKEKFQPVGSFGLTYSPVGELANGLEEVEPDEE